MRTRSGALRPLSSGPMAEQTVESSAPPAVAPVVLRGRTGPIDPEKADELFHDGVALFNGRRYWHAHEAWETLWRAAPDEERDFYQGLILVAAGLLHMQRRNLRGARNKLDEGVTKLRRYEPAHRGIFISELIGKGETILEDLNAGR